MSFRTKATLKFTLIVLLVLSLAGAGILFLYRHQQYNLVKAELEAVTLTIKGSIDPNSPHVSNLQYFLLPPGLSCRVAYENGDTSFCSAAFPPIASPFDEPLPIPDEPIHRRVGDGGIAYWVLSTPFVNNEKGLAWIQVARDMAQVGSSLDRMFWAIFVVISGSTFLTGLIFWLVITRELRHVRQMTRVVQGMVASEVLASDPDISIRGNSEVGQLADAINQLLRRLQKALHSQRMFMESLTHELRTPLTVLKGNIGLIRLTKQADDEALHAMEKEIDRLTRLINGLLTMSRFDEEKIDLQMTMFEFSGLFEEIYQQVKVLDNGVHNISMDQVEKAHILADRDHLKQVLLNLCHNAIKYTPQGGSIVIGMRKMRNEVCFWVADSGQGIPQDEIPHLFERDFRGRTNKKLHHGDGNFGIGLYIVDWVIKQHEGRIEVESRVGQGSTFYVWLPMQDPIST